MRITIHDSGWDLSSSYSLLKVHTIPYGITLYYSVVGGYLGISTSTFVSCVYLDAAPLEVRYLYHLSKTFSPSLWRGCINTLVSSTSRFTLTCHGTGGWLSPRAMNPSPNNKISILTNPRWRVYMTFRRKLRWTAGNNEVSFRPIGEEIGRTYGGDERGETQPFSRPRGSHVLLWKQTCHQTPRLASDGGPLLQFQRSVGIAVL